MNEQPEWVQRAQQEQQAKGPDTRPWWQKKRVLIPAAVIVAIAIGAAGGESDTEPEEAAATEEAQDLTPTVEPTAERTQTPEPTTPPTPEGPQKDASARLACGHFFNVIGDIEKGLLTDEEIREKIKEVYDSAWVSETPGIAQHGEAMLAAATQGDGEAFFDAAVLFGSSCNEAEG